MTSPYPIARLTVDCLLKLPTYDRDTFNREYMADRYTHFEFYDLNANVITIANVKDMLYAEMIKRTNGGANPPPRQSLKLYTGGFLNANFVAVGGPYVELVDSRTVASYGYIQTKPSNPATPWESWYSNEIICVTDSTCGGSCGPNGTCKKISKISDITSNTGWYVCTCRPGYSGMACNNFVNILDSVTLFVTTPPVSTSINANSIYQYGSGPAKFFLKQIDSNLTIGQVKSIISSTRPQGDVYNQSSNSFNQFPAVAANRINLWTGNSVGAYDVRSVDQSDGKP